MGAPAVRHLALVGTTASGKSSVALEVAAALGDLEIVTADSMQVYRGMDIGTAKPSPAERGAVPHHLLDMVDPTDEWTLTRWLAAARTAVADIESRGRRALLVGGTGLYLRALVDGLEPPGRFPDVAAALDVEADTAALHRRLEDLDPLAAARIDPANRRRVLRALEVVVGSGRPFSTFGPGLGEYPKTDGWRMAGVWLPRAVVARRVAARVDSMVATGLVGEVAALAAAGLGRGARQALGYREVLAHLETGVPLDGAIDEVRSRTRAYARRQRMWWRRDPRISWLGVVENPLAVAPVLLGEWRRP